MLKLVHFANAFEGRHPAPIRLCDDFRQDRTTWQV